MTLPLDVFLINLERAVDRRDYMLAELDRLLPGVPVSRAHAVDIKDPNWVPPALYTEGRWHSDRWSLAPSDIEIFHSHLYTWRRIAESDRLGAVMEDDLLFSDSFGAVMEAVLSARPDGIIRLDGLNRRILLGPRQEIGAGAALASLETAVPSSACYVITPEIAARLVEAARIERTVDDFLFDPYPADRGARGHGLPLYQCVPAVTAQAQWARFIDRERTIPEFLRVTKRVDMVHRKNFERSGPVLYRLRKEVLRSVRSLREGKRRKRVLAEGGSEGPVQPAEDLAWT